MAMSKEKHEVGEKKPKNQINLNPISRLFEKPQSSIEPYVRKGQVVADLGCNTGFYTLTLAECVGPEGRARMRVPKIANNGFKSVFALVYYGLFR